MRGSRAPSTDLVVYDRPSLTSGWQFLPPPCGAGLVQDLYRLWTPPPQDRREFLSPRSFLRYLSTQGDMMVDQGLHLPWTLNPPATTSQEDSTNRQQGSGENMVRPWTNSIYDMASCGCKIAELVDIHYIHT